MSDDYDNYRGGDPGADPADEWDSRPANVDTIAPVLSIVRDEGGVEATIDRHPAGQLPSSAEPYVDALAEIKTLCEDRTYFGPSPLATAVLAALARRGF